MPVRDGVLRQRWGSLLPFLLLLSLLVGVFLTNRAWVEADTQVRDGDEQGVLGTVEIFLQLLHQDGTLPTLKRVFTEDWGTYPPLFPATVAVLAHSSGAISPEDPRVDLAPTAFHLLSILLLFALGAALASPWTGLLASFLYASFPLVGGMSRHGMIEGALPAFTLALVLCLVLSRDLKRLMPSFLAGLCLALGMLTKQTFLLATAPLLLMATFRAGFRPPRSLPSLLALFLGPLLLALPWYAPRLEDSLRYGSESAAANDPTASLWRHLLYYPGATVGLVLGPALTLLFLLIFLPVLAPRGRRVLPQGPGWTWVYVWLLGSLLVLLLVPKKYERLLLPVAPALALLGAEALRRASSQSRLGRGLTLLTPGLGAMTYAVNAFAPQAIPSLPFAATLASIPTLDERCPQDWVGKPVADDLGFVRLLDALPPQDRARPAQKVLVLREPEIPCSYQTAFNYSFYLQYQGRLRGFNLEMMEGPMGNPQAAARALAEEPALLLLTTSPLACTPQGEAPGFPAGEWGQKACDSLPEFAPLVRVDSDSDTLPLTAWLYRRGGR